MEITMADTSSMHDEDVRHFATTAPQAPKPSMPPPISAPLLENLQNGNKDLKSFGTRFHEEVCYNADVVDSRSRLILGTEGGENAQDVIETEVKKPVGLLDLPVDILKEIVREVTHTNDLTSLALCHSALHALAIPHIYSRFDIVWPDTTAHAEPRSGVDALTYGLATLVMAEEIFGEAPGQREQQAQGNRFAPTGKGRATETAVRRRRGNHYAQYTKKFSLGNGPADWVSEYLISKEGGKMLGTLVALAVARMRILETFIWDMPTGILRDVWLALSSLAEREEERPCRLEKVWVRWHENVIPDQDSLAYSALGRPQLRSQVRPADMDRVEHPTFSVLPPLRSLSVLDVDELAYLDELAVLIGKSVDKLRELRVGIARHAMARDWVTVWQGNDLQQVDYENPTAGSLTIGGRRLGGVTGTLMGFVRDMREPRMSLPDRTRRTLVRPEVRLESSDLPGHFSEAVNMTSAREMPDPGPSNSSLSPPPHVTSFESDFNNDPLVASSRAASPQHDITDSPPSSPPKPTQRQPSHIPESPTRREASPSPISNRCLQLESLELERVPLSIPVLQQCLDWSCLTSLTVLHCQNHEALWKTLRRSFPPTPYSPTYPSPRRTSAPSPKKSGKTSSFQSMELEYPLKLKRLHTDTVSTALIAFLKDTLAPNTLEQLFLQEARSYASSVTVEAIFRGPLRRHRLSLKKLLIDSSERGLDGTPTSNTRWRKWMLTKEVLGFVVGGKMPALREFGAAIDYRDWHFFIEHLPQVPQLRSLYLPFLADHPHGPSLEPRDLAQQVMVVVALRPEIELCYMGIANKCYEILESKRGDAAGRGESYLGGYGTGAVGLDDGVGANDTEEDGEDDDLLEEDEDLDEEDEELMSDSETSDEDTDEDSDSDASSSDGAGRLRLREILFYDDKVSVFRARHGRL